MPEIRPQPGPQQAFLSSEADIAIYGGAAGGGKTYALTIEAVRNSGVPKFGGAVFRRLSSELTGPGSIWEEAMGMFPLAGGVPREGAQMDWEFPSGAMVEFRHLQYAKSVASHLSKQYALIIFDQLETFLGDQFWKLRLRNRSVCGIDPYIRAACNPDPDSFLYDNGNGLIAWWIGEDGYPIEERAGRLRYFVRDPSDDSLVWGSNRGEVAEQAPWVREEEFDPISSLTFIAARLEDNKILMANDPSYLAKLKGATLVDRERMWRGNWKIRPAAGTMFKRSWYGLVDAPPAQDQTAIRCRAWDLAATEPTKRNPDPAYSVGVLYSRGHDGNFYVEDVVRERVGPGGVESMLVRVAKQDRQRDGTTTQAVWRDPGGAGKHTAQTLGKLLAAFPTHFETAKENKVTYAKPASSQAEQGNVYLVRAPWNESYIGEHEAFPDGKYKDQVDATSLAHLFCTRDAGIATMSSSLDRGPQWAV